MGKNRNGLVRAVDRPAQREDSQILVVKSYERQNAGVQGVDGGCSCWTTERVLQKAPWWAQKQDQRLRRAMCLAESTGAGAWHIFCSRKHSKPRESGLGGFKVQKVKQKCNPEVPNELIFKCFSLYGFPLFKWIERTLAANSKQVK